MSLLLLSLHVHWFFAISNLILSHYSKTFIVSALGFALYSSLYFSFEIPYFFIDYIISFNFLIFSTYLNRYFKICWIQHLGPFSISFYRLVFFLDIDLYLFLYILVIWGWKLDIVYIVLWWPWGLSCPSEEAQLFVLVSNSHAPSKLQTCPLWFTVTAACS